MCKLYHSILLVILSIFQWMPCHAEDKLDLPSTEVQIRAFDGNELNAYQYPAKGKYLILWIGSSGWHDRTTQLAMDFANSGIEVWQIDYADALMQTTSSNFLRNLDGRYIADVIDAAHQRTGKQVLLFAQAYGAIPVLNGATIWQQRNRPEKLLGAILFSPDLVVGLPPLGKDPEYLPIARATNLPLLIFQGSLRGSAMQFQQLLKELGSNNPNVYFSMMPNVSGVFYRDEPNKDTISKLKEIRQNILSYIHLLESTPYHAGVNQYQQPRQESHASVDIKLQPFKGNPKPHSIKLSDANGRLYTLNDFRGKVTVVNFWATWCPPCVAEIPSLNRLREQMQGEPFELISINYAETPKTINEFMHRVSVQFPVLIDPKGAVSQQWNVIGFPSTFVIGRDGRIIYGVNAAIHWDTPEVVSVLKALSH